MQKVVVVYNPAAGKVVADKTELTALLKQHHITAHFVDIRGDVRQQIEGADQGSLIAIVAAGGDGTVNTAAHEAVHFGLPLGVLPLGTLNHFAKDLNIPLDLTEAVALVASAKPCAIDYATVNGKIFMNNSSLGVYPGSLEHRKHLGRHIGKWPAAFIAVCVVYIHAPRPRLAITIGDKTIRSRTPYMFIGNNAYTFTSPLKVSRKSLAGHTLYYQIFTATGLRSLIKRLLSPHDHRPNFISDQTSETIVVSSSKKSLKVSVDGEVLTLSTPLNYKQMPSAIEVLAPRL